MKFLVEYFLKIKKNKKKSKRELYTFFLESRIPVSLDDKFVIRSYSPMNTIGGGIVLDPFVDQYYFGKNNFINNIPLNPKERFLF